MTKELVSFQQTSKQGDLARGLGSLPLLIHILFDWQRRLSDKRRYGRRRSNGLARREAVVYGPYRSDKSRQGLIDPHEPVLNELLGVFDPSPAPLV